MPVPGPDLVDGRQLTGVRPMTRVDTAAGITVMVVGMLLLVTAAASDLLHLGQARWHSSPTLLALAGLLVLLAGGVLAAE